MGGKEITHSSLWWIQKVLYDRVFLEISRVMDLDGKKL